MVAYRFTSIRLLLAAVALVAAAGSAAAQVVIDPNGAVTIGSTANPNTLTVTGALSGPSVVPVGAVIDWYPPPGQTTPPPNFVLCDGNMITVRNSPFYNSPAPDLRNVFVRGAPTVADAKKGGGADATTYDLSVNLPAQTGAIPDSAPLSANTKMGLIVRNNSSDAYRYILTTNEGWNDGQHVHTLGGTAKGTLTVNTLPKYYTLVKIMRVL